MIRLAPQRPSPARCRVAECLCRHGKAVDPGLQLAWDPEVVHRGAEHNDVGRDELIEHRVDGREVMLQLGARSIVAWRVSYLHLYGPGVKCPALRKRFDFEVQQCRRVMGYGHSGNIPIGDFETGGRLLQTGDDAGGKLPADGPAA